MGGDKGGPRGKGMRGNPGLMGLEIVSQKRKIKKIRRSRDARGITIQTGKLGACLRRA